MATEFVLTDADFNTIRKLVYDHTGINLSSGKKDMIYSRLTRRLRQLGLSQFKEYLALLDDEHSDEIGNFINSVTTNLTSFFREMHHFEHLKNELLPLLMRIRADERQIRIWSAGCSTGEEPYSIAMTVKETIPDSAGWDVRILATDLDTNVLETASRGVYAEDRLNGVPKDKLKRWFKRGKGATAGKVRIHQDLRDMIIFKQLNLMQKWPIKPGVDILFCRNVVIYFDKPTQKVLFDRYANILADHGRMLIGHSETLYNVCDRFDLLGHTVYKKKC